jgi:hypothetical protein
MIEKTQPVQYRIASCLDEPVNPRISWLLAALMVRYTPFNHLVAPFGKELLAGHASSPWDSVISIAMSIK